MQAVALLRQGLFLALVLSPGLSDTNLRREETVSLPIELHAGRNGRNSPSLFGDAGAAATLDHRQLAASSETATCSNGLRGVEGFQQCCVLECGTCGGTGCEMRAQEVGLTADDCCVTSIRSSGVMCEDSMEAPCNLGDGDVPTPAPTYATCSNGLRGVEGFQQCCVLECGTCGGTGCEMRAEEAGLTADDCCVTSIRSSGVMCEDSMEAPCNL